MVKFVGLYLLIGVVAIVMSGLLTYFVILCKEHFNTERTGSFVAEFLGDEGLYDQSKMEYFTNAIVNTIIWPYTCVTAWATMMSAYKDWSSRH